MGLNVLGCRADIFGTNCNKLLKLKITGGGVGGVLWTPSSGFIPPHHTVELSSLLILRSHSDDDSIALDIAALSLSLLHTSWNFGPRQYVLCDNLVLYKTSYILHQRHSRILLSVFHFNFFDADVALK